MTDLSQRLAPGCFGIGLIYKAEANECRVCPFQERCGPLAAERLAALRLKLGIVEKRPVVAKSTVRPAPAKPQTSMALPKKVEELMVRIERAGIKVTETLARGENPFQSKPFFMRIACHLLLRIPAGISRDQLKSALMSKLDWGDGTAAAHALQAVQLLEALGAAKEEDGILRLRRHG